MNSLITLLLALILSTIKFLYKSILDSFVEKSFLFLF
jgi:hypothetical protein